MGNFDSEAMKWLKVLMLFCVKVPAELVRLFTGCFLSKRVDDFYTQMLGSVLPGSDPDNYAGSIYGIGYIKQFIRSRYLEITKPAQIGQAAPNSDIISLEDHNVCKVFDYGKKNRPLVLNFGSCTWPPFIAKLSKFNALVDEFCDTADFLVIYIEEAHASDGWKFKNNFDIKIHRTTKDRLNAAEQLKELGVHCPIVVDTMKNSANEDYGGLYERLYILKNGIVEYQGDRGPVGYKLEEVETWLRKNCDK